MERIGLAASKIAKGNIFLYNIYVILIAFLFALFVFVIAGSTVVFAVVILRYIAMEITPELNRDWSAILSVSMFSLTLVLTVFYLLALSKNIKFKKH